MVLSREATGRRARLRFGNVSPSTAADEELRWFFNAAEEEVDQPSSFMGLLTGDSPTSLAAVERRAEALHSAGKIRARLQAISLTHAQMLEALYTERPWPRHMAQVLAVLARPYAAYALAVLAYERARGTGPSVVPGEER